MSHSKHHCESFFVVIRFVTVQRSLRLFISFVIAHHEPIVVAHGCPKTLVFCLTEIFNPEPIVFYYLSVNSSVYDICQNTLLKS
jgi:hypothetical protein